MQIFKPARRDRGCRSGESDFPAAASKRVVPLSMSQRFGLFGLAAGARTTLCLRVYHCYLCCFPFFLLGQSPFHALRNEFAFNKRVYNLFLGQKSLFQLLSNCFYSVSGQQKKQTTNNFQECPTLLAAPHFENASSCSNSTPMSTFQNIHTVKYSLIVVLMKFWLIKLKPYNL